MKSECVFFIRCIFLSGRMCPMAVTHFCHEHVYSGYAWPHSDMMASWCTHGHPHCTVKSCLEPTLDTKSARQSRERIQECYLVQRQCVRACDSLRVVSLSPLWTSFWPRYSDDGMGLSVETFFWIPSGDTSKKPFLRNGNAQTMNKAISPVKTSRTRSPVLQNRQSYRRLGETRATPRVSSFVTPPLFRSLRGKQLENQTHHHGQKRGLREMLHFGNHWVHRCLLKNVSATTLTQSNLDLFLSDQFGRILTMRSYPGMKKTSRPYEMDFRHGWNQTSWPLRCVTRST